MTDIHEAMRKHFGEETDFAAELADLDDVKLFPPPPAALRMEFARVAGLLLELKRPERGVVIAIASTVSGEGASFVSYNVARILALGLGRRSVWIDANFRSPQLRLLTSGDETFASFLDDPTGVLCMQSDSRFQVVPGGHELSLRSARMSSEALAEVYGNFSQKFDFTIVDCPPILGEVETSYMAAAADGLAVVIESRNLKHEVVAHGLESLRSMNVNVLGAVLNKREFELPKVIYDRL